MRSPSQVLFVEGGEDQYLVYQVCNASGIDNRASFEVKYDAVQGGWCTVRDSLALAVRKLPYRAVAAIVDADADILGRWMSITTPLRSIYPDLPFAPVPGGLVLPATATRPRLGLWLMPDNDQSGAIEHFFLGLVRPDDSLIVHAHSVVAAVPGTPPFGGHLIKATAHTWLAWRTEPGQSMGEAVRDNEVDITAGESPGLVAWLRATFLAED